MPSSKYPEGRAWPSPSASTPPPRRPIPLGFFAPVHGRPGDDRRGDEAARVGPQAEPGLVVGVLAGADREAVGRVGAVRFRILRGWFGVGWPEGGCRGRVAQGQADLFDLELQDGALLPCFRLIGAG